MKVEAYVMLFVGAFFAAVCGVYWFTSNETSGTLMLLGTCLLGFVPGGYYYWWARRMKPRPEDDPRAERSDGQGVVGAFPGSSVWPFVLGVSAASVGLALVFGFWTAIVGLVLVVAVIIGIIKESRRGGLV